MDKVTQTLELSRCGTCTQCSLHEGVETVCVKSVSYLPVAPEKARAILIVGEAPGHLEDVKGEPFIGASGHLLRRVYVEFFKFHVDCDVYLGNAVRCRPAGNKTPNKTQLKSCQPYLLADICRLQEEYEEVIILAVGATACQSVLGCGLGSAGKKQGHLTDFQQLMQPQKLWDMDDQELELERDLNRKGKLWQHVRRVEEWPEPCRVFSTFHPAAVLRDPSRALAVKSHLELLRDYLDGNLKYEIVASELEIRIAPVPPKYSISILSLDIETYGILKSWDKGRKQMFHPMKSHLMDEIPKDKMVVTTGLSWRDPEGVMRHAIFRMADPTHVRRLAAWLQHCKRDPEFRFILLQNATFDLMYLRFCYPSLKLILEGIPIWDLIITNYLYDESRPEKSLKNLAPLLRVSEYECADKFIQYDSDKNRELWAYNCQDTAVTLRLHEKIEGDLKNLYEGTNKLDHYCYQWYNKILWLIIWMTETGVKQDERTLREIFKTYEKALAAILSHSSEAFECPLRGKGSEGAKRSILEDCFGEAVQLGHSPDVAKTDIKKTIKFDVENRNILLPLVERGGRNYKRLKLLGAYQDVSGLLDRYLFPLLVGRGKDHANKDTLLLRGISYPRWFPVPSEFEDSSGGTKQARIIAKGPPVQTFPPMVKSTIEGRFPGGYSIWFDYSQIELRIAALLSNDPPMMEEYQGKPDLHTATARIIFGNEFVDDYIKTHGIDAWKGSEYRQAGKTTNFLMLFRGGARKLQESLMRDVGLVMSLESCVEIIKAFWTCHKDLWKWQQKVLAFVAKHGYYELPLIGQSRLFLGGKGSQRRVGSEIINLPVQATAANVMLSCQHELWWQFKQRRMKAIVPLNVYDAAHIESPRGEIYAVRRIMEEVIPNPPYFQDLCNHLGRSIPMEYDVKESRS